MFDMGIHAIDLCLWLFGPVRAVSGRAATLIKKIEVDDNAVMLLDFKNGALGYIEVGWTSKPGFSGLEIYGTEGSLICDYINGLKLCGGKASAGRDSRGTQASNIRTCQNMVILSAVDAQNHSRKAQVTTFIVKTFNLP